MVSICALLCWFSYFKCQGCYPICSPDLTFKDSAIRNYLLNCNNVPSFEEFAILANGNNKFLLEIQESLLIKRDRPILYKNISSAKLCLFENSILIVSLHSNIV